MILDFFKDTNNKLDQDDSIIKNWFTLSFIAPVEREFLREYFNKSLKHVRVALLIAIAIYSIFGLLDAKLLTDNKGIFWLIRFGIFAPFTMIVMLFSFSSQFIKYYQLLCSSVVLIAGIGINIMIVIAPQQVSYSYYAGLILVFIYGYTFCKVRFIYATFAAWLIVITYEITAIFFSDTPMNVLISNNFFFLTGNILGMFAGYSIELHIRKAYIQTRLLEEEKQKVKLANIKLEDRVTQRTSQLNDAIIELKEEIFERKKSELACRQGEEKYRAILEGIEEGYYEVDLLGNIQFYNEAATKILGYNKKELEGCNFKEFADRPTIKKIIRSFYQIFKTGFPVKGVDFRIFSKNRTEKIISMSAGLLKNESGEPAGFRGIMRDVTDRILAEEKIRRMNDELEKRVNERTFQLNLANDALKNSLKTLQETQNHLVQNEKMAALGSLVAGVAHEINTPVGIGVTAASLMEEKTESIIQLHHSGKMKRSQFEDYLQLATDTTRAILSNLFRAADLIRSFKQVAVDQSSEEQRKFNLKEYIGNILISLRPKLKNSQYEIQINCPENIEIFSYPGIFSQIFTNLIMNSLIHGFELTPNGVITIVAEINDNILCLRYSDDGKGMDSETLKNIYNPFFSTKRTKGGTGLGLHIVFNLINQTLNGNIVCKSTPGAGTEFEIKIPMAMEKKYEPQLT